MFIGPSGVRMLAKLFQHLVPAGPNCIHTFIKMSAAGKPKTFQLGSSRKKDASQFLDCFRRMTKHKEHWNKWTVDQRWIDVTKEGRGLNESMQFAAEELNGAAARNAGHKSAGVDTATSTSLFGIHKSSCRPSGDQSQACQRVAACCIATPGAKPSEMPGGNSKWRTSLVSHMPDGTSKGQNPMKRSLPETPAPAMKRAPAQKKKRKGMTTRGNGEENAIDSGQLEATRMVIFNRQTRHLKRKLTDKSMHCWQQTRHPWM
jgi:hypothetical protein